MRNAKKTYMAGLTAGLIVGLIIGLLVDNLAMGIGCGLAIGAFGSTVSDTRDRLDEQKQNKNH